VIIVIDAYQAAAAITGTDRMAFNLLRELQELDQDNQYVVITNALYPYISDCLKAPNFRVHIVHAKKRLLWLNFKLPGLLRELRADVFYSFHNFAGPGTRVCRTVCTLLDAIPITDPDLYFGNASSIKRLAVRTSMMRTARLADAFVAISEFTKQSAVSALGLPPQDIQVMTLQADPGFFLPATTERLVEVARTYDLPKDFVFALGSSDPRKNVAKLLVAHRALPDSLRSKYPLLIGGAKWHNERVEISGDPHARLLGFIADADLPLVYRLATLFVFPSLFEGFGLTVLEAMSSDTPVITSNTTSIPEAAGDAAVLIDPSSTHEITQAMRQVLESKQEQRRLVRAGRKQVRNFSWKQAAIILLGVLEDVEPHRAR
jgi:glycosyltransferase involved in cell wall biosynthesis